MILNIIEMTKLKKVGVMKRNYCYKKKEKKKYELDINYTPTRY